MLENKQCAPAPEGKTGIPLEAGALLFPRARSFVCSQLYYSR
jgi:hypothetical protein